MFILKIILAAFLKSLLWQQLNFSINLNHLVRKNLTCPCWLNKIVRGGQQRMRPYRFDLGADYLSALGGKSATPQQNGLAQFIARQLFARSHLFAPHSH